MIGFSWPLRATVSLVEVILQFTSLPRVPAGTGMDTVTSESVCVHEYGSCSVVVIECASGCVVEAISSRPVADGPCCSVYVAVS